MRYSLSTFFRVGIALSIVGVIQWGWLAGLLMFCGVVGLSLAGTQVYNRLTAKHAEQDRLAAEASEPEDAEFAAYMDEIEAEEQAQLGHAR